jgi:hypothetical protein
VVHKLTTGIWRAYKILIISLSSRPSDRSRNESL